MPDYFRNFFIFVGICLQDRKILRVLGPALYLFQPERAPSHYGYMRSPGVFSHLAQREHVSASTQNQALNALVFLYKQVIQKELGSIEAVRARRPKRLPERECM